MPAPEFFLKSWKTQEQFPCGHPLHPPHHIWDIGLWSGGDQEMDMVFHELIFLDRKAVVVCILF